jgi:hypothetical protein
MFGLKCTLFGMMFASSAALLAVPSIAFAQPLAGVEACITINHVTALDAVDPTWPTPADFYAKISIGDRTYTSPFVRDQNDISPNWHYCEPVFGSGVHYIRIEIWDKDPLVPGDFVDVNPRGEKRGLDLFIDTDKIGDQKCEVRGDVSGKCGEIISVAGSEQKRASLRFTVDVGLVKQQLRLKKSSKR